MRTPAFNYPRGWFMLRADAGVFALFVVWLLVRAVTLVVYQYRERKSRFLWCETGNTLEGVVYIRQARDSVKTVGVVLTSHNVDSLGG